MQELMRVLLLLLRENVVDLAIEISCRLDLCAPPYHDNQSSSAGRSRE